jgi:predicted NBD/HSP70 family sugar kinase
MVEPTNKVEGHTYLHKVNVADIRTANPLAVKQVNRTIILNLIRQLQPISRAELAGISGLNRSTVTDIIKVLLEEKLLLETGLKESSGGRRAIELRLNAEIIQGVVIEIGVGNSAIYTGDVDGNTERLASFKTPTDPAEFVANCRPVLDRILRAAPPGVYRGIGISIPALVNPATGTVCFAPNIGWRAVELGSTFGDHYGLPVFVENEANLCALAEMWFGGKGIRDAIDYAFVSVTAGIGAGIVIDNRLYRGVSGMAGEFGHMTIQLDGPPCGCGNHGCWETLASELAAVRQYLGKPDGTADGDLPFAEILMRAGAGEDKAKETLSRMGKHLGVGIANIIKGLDLKTIVIGGNIVRIWTIMEPIIHEEVIRHLPPASIQSLRLIPSDIEGANVMGALVQSVSPIFSGVTLR